MALIVATALCYLIGYPLAIVGGVAAGWILVALGGPLLLWLLAIVIRRVHASTEAEPNALGSARYADTNPETAATPSSPGRSPERGR